MRQRRAERCLLRASAALDAEVPEAAGDVLEEARALCPDHPDLAVVTSRLVASSTVDLERREPVSRWTAAMLVSVALGVGWGSIWVRTPAGSAAVADLVNAAASTAAYVATAAATLVAP